MISLLLITCSMQTLHGMQWMKNQWRAWKTKSNVKKIRRAQTRTPQQPQYHPFERTPSRQYTTTPSTTTPLTVQQMIALRKPTSPKFTTMPISDTQKIIPPKSIISKAFEYFRHRTPFETQELQRDQYNITTLIANSIQSWPYDSKVTPQFLVDAKPYLNRPVFDDKTMLSKALNDFIQADAIEKIVNTYVTLQDTTNALYARLFPSYQETPDLREDLERTRRNILNYIDGLITLHAQLGAAPAETIRFLLCTIQITETLFIAGNNPEHRYTASGSHAMEAKTIASFFAPIKERLQRIAKKEKLDYATISAQAFNDAALFLETKFGILLTPNTPKPEDL